MVRTLKPATLFSLLHKHREIFLPYRGRILLGVLALLLTNLLGIAIPWQMKLAVEAIQKLFSQQASTETLLLLWPSFGAILLLISGLALAVLISRVSSRLFLLGAGRRVEADLRNRLYGHLLKMPTDYYAAHPAGELMSRMTNDVDASKYLTGGGIMLGVNTLLAYLTTIPMMLIISWQLALVTFLVYPVMIWVMTRISRKVRQGYLQVQEVLADISTVAQENLNGMMVIQSYVREEQENQRFEAICDKYFGTYTRLIRERILLYMVLAALSGFSMLMVLLVGGGQVIGHQLDWGGFVAFTMYLEHLAWPTMALGWTISIFQQGTAALERIDDVLSTEPSIKSGEAPSAAMSPFPEQASAETGSEKTLQGALALHNLTFAYQNPYTPTDDAMVPRETDSWPVLYDINLTIRSGETVALVGPVGSGKSTLLRLLPRLYDVPPRSIFLDDRDITEFPLAVLRENIVFMPQLSFLFSTTVSRNIAFGHPEALDSAEDLERVIIPAAETASVHLDIQGLPNRYQTLVGERGLMLSGGQRQRVALARAILTDAKVLVLDDPFSNVDAETERTIVQALHSRKVFRNKTTLIATHRFSLIGLCDRVVLMDAGRIVAVGTPDELLATQPLYQRLHQLQQLRETLGAWALEPENGNGCAVPDLAAPEETD
ncbi:MAG TPA: ABC transporter ATP-binding protein [Coleofasciculaceae cyanobacterium]|jgi:ATP-binding cassette subfamily B protein